MKLWEYVDPYQHFVKFNFQRYWRIKKGSLLLNITSLFPADPQSAEISWIASRVLNDIVSAMRTNSVDEKELVALRTIIFFDPSESFETYIWDSYSVFDLKKPVLS